MRARDIKPGFYKSDQLAECSMTARLLFPGLWMLADREGRLENRPRKIKAEIFPFDDVDVAPLLVELENAGLIRTYEVNGTALVWIPQFKRHQSPHKNEKSSELPAHPDDLSVTCPVQEQAKDRTTPEKEGTAPVISGQIPLTPSSLTPSSLSPKDNTTPDGVVADAVPGDDPDAPANEPDEKNPRMDLDRPDPHARPGEIPCPHKRIIEAYEAILPELPRVRVWRAQQASDLRARWREKLREGKFSDEESGVDYFRRFFGYVRRSEFLMGRRSGRDGRTFRNCLAWMVKAKNFDGIVDGKYHDQEVA